MSKNATASTNRIRARMQRARFVAISSGSGIHVRVAHAYRAKAVKASKELEVVTGTES